LEGFQAGVSEKMVLEGFQAGVSEKMEDGASSTPCATSSPRELSNVLTRSVVMEGFQAGVCEKVDICQIALLFIRP
jgi:cellulase/cellobiase CelA1